MTDIDLETSTNISPQTNKPKLGKNTSIVLWVILAVVFLAFFTFYKLPTAKLKNYIHGIITTTLADKGMNFIAETSELNLGLGVSYYMEGITLSSATKNSDVTFDKIIIKPKLLSLISQKLSGDLVIEKDDGSIESAFTLNQENFDINFDIDDINLKNLQLINLFTGIKLFGNLEGNGEIEGEFKKPQTWLGDIKLNIENVILPKQNIKGFDIPELLISEIIINTVARGGKVIIKECQIGKASNAKDDIILTADGTIDLASNINLSKIDLNLKLKLSEKVHKSLVLLDSLLGGGKTSEGDYKFNIQGTIGSPKFNPDK